MFKKYCLKQNKKKQIIIIIRIIIIIILGLGTRAIIGLCGADAAVGGRR